MADDSENLALVAKQDPPSNYTGGGGGGEQTTVTPEEPAPVANNVHPPIDTYDASREKIPLKSQGQGQNGQGQGQGDGDGETDDGYSSALAELHESAISAAGFGRMQYILLVVLGFGLMGDGVELFVVSFILPGAEKDLCMTASMKGWLGSIAFAGMMVGAVIWGNLADKIGRRSTLLTALFINLVASAIGAFVPTYWLFLICRLFSGVGIGGSIPIVFAYFGEFCPRLCRGQKIGIFFIWWTVGGIYVSALGWLIIPKQDVSFEMAGGMMFNSWRVFLVICLVPCIISVVGLLFMPESPRFLLEVGRDLDALTVFRDIYRMNHSGTPGAEYEMPEIRLPDRPIKSVGGEQDGEEPPETLSQKFATGLDNFWNPVFALFFSPLTKITLLLCVAWFAIAFGYYGLSIWFPEILKKWEQHKYFSKQITLSNQTLFYGNFTGIMENVQYKDSYFSHIKFLNLEMKHIIFDNVTIDRSIFSRVDAKQSYFRNCLIRDTVFDHTNLYADRFQNSLLDNVNFTSSKPGCTVDFDINYSERKVYLEQFIGQLAIIPGNIISALLMDVVGRTKVLAVSLFLSGISVFFIWFANEEIGVVVVNCIFNFLTIGAWNGLDCISVELYPTHLRSTGFGVLSCLGRIAAIFGNVAFGQLIDVNRAVPILITATIMVLGGVISLKLPESKGTLLK